MTVKNIVWLASYPKSGNTWTRVFLSNYLFAAEDAFPINQVHRLGIGDAVTKAYETVCTGPFNPNDHMLTLKLRGKVLRRIVGNRADMNFVKTHNINDQAFRTVLIPPEFTRAAVYIVRNPLDVAISYGRHFGYGASTAVASIGRSDNTTAGDKNSVKQFLGTWSEHVLSWMETRRFPVHVQRYEDMLTEPHESFAKMLKFIGIPTDEARLDRAVRNSSFEELRKQEDKSGFVEGTDKSERFFHTGTSGQWQGVLFDEDVAKVHADHGKVMKRLGYL